MFELIYHYVGIFLLLNYIMTFNTQVPRYQLFCEGGIFSAHALTLVGTKLTPYISVALKFISLILQVSDT